MTDKIWTMLICLFGCCIKCVPLASASLTTCYPRPFQPRRNPCIDIRGVHFHCSLVRTYMPVNTSSAKAMDNLPALKSAEDFVGGLDALSRELGEQYVRQLHGFAPPATVSDLCSEQPGCMSRLSKYNHAWKPQRFGISRVAVLGSRTAP